MPKIKRMAFYANQTLSDRILCVAAEIEEAFIQGGLTEGAYSGKEILAMAVDLVKPEYQNNQLSICTGWPDHPLKTPGASLAKWTASAPIQTADTALPSGNQKLLRLPEVMEVTGLKKSSIYAGGKEGSFPMPIKMAKRIVAWREHDIQQWIRSRV